LHSPNVKSFVDAVMTLLPLGLMLARKLKLLADPTRKALQNCVCVHT